MYVHIEKNYSLRVQHAADYPNMYAISENYMEKNCPLQRPRACGWLTKLVSRTGEAKGDFSQLLPTGRLSCMIHADFLLWCGSQLGLFKGTDLRYQNQLELSLGVLAASTWR
jgi:hypothetical protein